MRLSPPLIIRFIVGWLPAFVCAGLIFYLSSRPAKTLPAPWFPHMDKIIHALEYGALALLIFRALFWPDFRHIPAGVLLRYILYILVFCALYGFTDEIHQIYVPGRAADIFDWAADALGAALALAYCWYCFYPKRPTGKNSNPRLT